MTLQRQLESLVAAHRRQVRKLVAARTVWLAIVAGFALLYADLFFQFGDPLRLSLDVAFLVGLTLAAVVTRRWLIQASNEELRIARLVEEGNPELRNDLVSAIDFEKSLESQSPRPVSTDLMRRQIGIATEEVRGLKRLDSLKPPALRSEVRTLLVSSGAAILLLVLFTDHFTAVAPRFLNPFGDHPPYSPTRLQVDPPGATVDYGQGLTVTVKTSGPKPSSVSLTVLDPRRREITSLVMLEDGDGRYFQNLENIQDDALYFVRIPGGRSKRHRLSVTKWPKVQSATVSYEPPAYTRLPKETRYLNDGVLKGYRNTKATLTLLSNRPLRGGTVTVCETEFALTPRDANTVSATFPILTGGTFSATIIDQDGNVGRDKFEGIVEVLPDLKPEVAIVSPGMDSFATPDATVPLTIEARDDLGITRIELFRNRNGSLDDRKSLQTLDGGEKFVNTVESLALPQLGVKPGDVIEYYATATDTAPDGPHTAATPAYRLAIISDEQYRELLQTRTTAEDLTRHYGELLEQMRSLAEKQASLEREVSQLKTNLEQNGSLSSEQQQALRRVQQAQTELARQTERFERQLDDEAKQAPVFDIEKDYKQALEKFARQMMEARAAMERSATNLQVSAETAAGTEGLSSLTTALEHQREALDRLGQNREEFQKGIQQANRDLERISHLLEDVERFKALLDRQKGLERQARSHKDVAAPNLEEQIRFKELSEEQEQVAGELAALRQDFQTHAAEVAEDYPKVADDARKIADEIRERRIGELMDGGATRLAWADARGGHERVKDAYDQMQAMVRMVEQGASGAAGECELRLQIMMSMGLGNTIQQLAKGMKAGQGSGMGSALGGGLAGSSGMSGGQSQFAVFGPDARGLKNQSSRGGGRSDRKTQAAPEQPETVAASFEELATSKSTDAELSSVGGEQIMQEYRQLIEAYFKRLAEDPQGSP